MWEGEMPPFCKSSVTQDLFSPDMLECEDSGHDQHLKSLKPPPALKLECRRDRKSYCSATPRSRDAGSLTWPWNQALTLKVAILSSKEILHNNSKCKTKY